MCIIVFVSLFLYLCAMKQPFKQSTKHGNKINGVFPACVGQACILKYKI